MRGIRKPGLLLVLVVALLLGSSLGASAQFSGQTFTPVVYYYSNVACPTTLGGVASLPNGGAFCWRTDTSLLYMWTGPTTAWQLIVPGTNAQLTTPAITGGTITGATITSSTLVTPSLPSGLLIGGATGAAVTSSGFQAVGNDLIVQVSSTTTAPAGPGAGAATIRLRKSPIIPGWCRWVVAGGNGFQEYVIPVVNPAFPFGAQLAGSAQLGVVVDNVLLDFPGGPSGC